MDDIPVNCPADGDAEDPPTALDVGETKPAAFAVASLRGGGGGGGA